MAIRPKQILDTAVGVGRTVVEAAERRLRGRKSDGPSGAPSTVGAATPGAAGAPKSASAPKAKAKAKPRKPAKKRAAASRAAATSHQDVADAAKKS